MQELIAQVDKLLDASSWTGDELGYLKRACAWRQDALDDLTRHGLSGTPTYSAIERVSFSPSLGPDDSPQKRLELVRAHCAPGLRFIKGRLEAAAKVSVSPEVSPSPSVLPAKVSLSPEVSPPPDVPPKEVRTIRREVAKIIRQELSQLLSESNMDYDSMRERHPDFSVFPIAEKNPDKVPLGDFDESYIILQHALRSLPEHSRHLGTLAKAFVAAHFRITPGTVKKDLTERKMRPKAPVS